MATQRYYICPHCKNKQWPATLFDALRDCATGNIPKCMNCDIESDLHLTFSFGLDVGDHPAKVVAAFFPDNISSWEDAQGAFIEFYPFLVVVQSLEEGHKSIWLPYWHIRSHENRVEKKYGQWAPFIHEGSFLEMLDKARNAGLLP